MSRAVHFLLAVLFVTSSARASDDAMSCVKQLTIPSAYSMVFADIPATVQASVTIGKKGEASAIQYDTKVRALQLQLDTYFKEKTKYLQTCAGRTVTFIVEYRVVEPALDGVIA